jgi:hypothetical protein
MKDRLRKVQFKYLDYLFENICWVKSKFYPDSTFFKKDDKVILELEKSGTLWVLYSVWASISDTFSLQYEETQQLIKEWMESQLKSGEVAPDCNFNTNIIRVQEEIKKEGVTPQIRETDIYNRFIESRLELEEVKPHLLGQGWSEKVKEKLKSEEVTPRSSLPPLRWTNLKSEEITQQI